MKTVDGVDYFPEQFEMPKFKEAKKSINTAIQSEYNDDRDLQDSSRMIGNQDVDNTPPEALHLNSIENEPQYLVRAWQLEEHHEVEVSRLNDSGQIVSNNRVLELNQPIAMEDEEFKDDSRYRANNIDVVKDLEIEENIVEEHKYEENDFHTGRNLLIESNKTDLLMHGEEEMGSMMLASASVSPNQLDRNTSNANPSLDASQREKRRANTRNKLHG